MKVIVYMEAQDDGTKEYPIFSGQLTEGNLDAFRKKLRKAVVKVHATTELR